MSENTEQHVQQIEFVLPQQGLLYAEEVTDFILCKPKLMPLKSITLEKLDKMQKEAEMKFKETQTSSNNDQE